MIRRAIVAVLLLTVAGCSSGTGSSASGGSASSSSTPGSSSAPGSSSSASASAGAGSNLVDIGEGLKGPAGLVATVYATNLPTVAALAFDSSGRLWAATADYTDAGKDGVYLMTAAGAAPQEVISGLHTPLGLLWLDGSLYVSSAGKVEEYSGFDGTGFASHRTVVSFESGVGELNGLALSPDGRIVLGISAPCDHCVPTTANSASIVSFAPDGSDLQTVASGIRAPVGLAYYPGTSDLFVSMDQRDDLGDATPGDWLAQVATGSNWGFPDCYGQTTATCATVPQPVAVLDPHAAVSGVAIVTGQLGPTVGTSALVAEWSIGTVRQVGLTKAGSTYTGTATTFLTGLKSPVPVIVGPDGSVFVGDWGTGLVYRIAKA